MDKNKKNMVEIIGGLFSIVVGMYGVYFEQLRGIDEGFASVFVGILFISIGILAIIISLINIINNQNKETKILKKIFNFFIYLQLAFVLLLFLK